MAGGACPGHRTFYPSTWACLLTTRVSLLITMIVFPCMPVGSGPLPNRKDSIGQSAVRFTDFCRQGEGLANPTG